MRESAGRAAERVCSKRAAFVGAAAWALAASIVAPHPYDASWARVLFLLAPAVCLPLLWHVFRAHAPFVQAKLRPRGIALVGWWAFATGALAFAQLLEPGALAALAAAPWALLLLTVGVDALRSALRPRAWLASPTAACAGSAPLLALVGAAWTLFDRSGVRPLDLPPEIVLLTAIHFHFAGIVLPLVTARLLDGRRDFGALLTAVLVVGGVPFVALGITAVQWGAPPLAESLAAWAMAAGGFLVALRLAAAGRRSGQPAARGAAFVAAAALAVGMTLAVLYAARHWLALDWLDIPWMRGVHGSVNALGFALGASFFVAGERRS